jgi:hypothetical protein
VERDFYYTPLRRLLPFGGGEKAGIITSPFVKGDGEGFYLPVILAKTRNQCAYPLAPFPWQGKGEEKERVPINRDLRRPGI